MRVMVIVILLNKNFLRRLVTLLSKESEAFLVNFKPLPRNSIYVIIIFISNRLFYIASRKPF